MSAIDWGVSPKKVGEPSQTPTGKTLQHYIQCWFSEGSPISSQKLTTHRQVKTGNHPGGGSTPWCFPPGTQKKTQKRKPRKNTGKRRGRRAKARSLQAQQDEHRERSTNSPKQPTTPQPLRKNSAQSTALHASKQSRHNPNREMPLKKGTTDTPGRTIAQDGSRKRPQKR